MDIILNVHSILHTQTKLKCSHLYLESATFKRKTWLNYETKLRVRVKQSDLQTRLRKRHQSLKLFTPMTNTSMIFNNLSIWKQYVNIFAIKFKRDNCQFFFLLASYSCTHESRSHNLILHLILIPFKLELIGDNCHFPSKIQRTCIVSTIQPDTYNNKQQKKFLLVIHKPFYLHLS